MPRAPLRLILALVLTLTLYTTTGVQAGQRVLAVFNLRPTCIEAMGYNGDILYALLAALDREAAVQVMPRREMEEALYHAGLSQSDVLEQVLKSADILRTDFILFGKVSKQATLVSAEICLLDTRRRQVVKTWAPVFTGREAIGAKIPDLVKELSAVAAGSHAPKATPAVARPEASAEGLVNLSAQVVAGGVVLQWSVVPGTTVVAFNIYRASGPNAPRKPIGHTERTVFNDQEGCRGDPYRYFVNAVLASGREIQDPTGIEARCPRNRVPHPPLVLSGTGGVRRAEIRFVPSLLNKQEKFVIREYRLYRQDGGKLPSTPVISVAAGQTDTSPLSLFKKSNIKLFESSEVAVVAEDRTFTDDGGSFTYTVSAVAEDGGESPHSDPVAVDVVPAPRLELVQDNLLRKIHLRWTPLPAVEGYRLYRRADDGEWGQVAVIPGSDSDGYTDETALSDGTTYHYALTAFDAKNETGRSQTIVARTKQLPPPPAGLWLENGLVKAVRLTWQPLSDPDVGGYVIYRGTAPDALKAVHRIKGRHIGAFFDKGMFLFPLEDGHTYFYALSSFNLFEAESERTPLATARTKPRPGAVAGLTVKAEGDTLVLAWAPNPENDLKHYTLQRSRNSGQWDTLDNVAPDRTAYRDTDLKPAGTYRYRLVAEDRDGLKSDPAESAALPSPLKANTE